MRSFLFSRLAFLLSLAMLLLADVSAAQEAKLKLEQVEKVWDQAPHNAFTDLVRYQDRWVLAFREAPKHDGGVHDSQIRILTSDDTKTWNSSSTIQDHRGDIRDAKLARMPDGRLMLLTATQLFEPSQQRHQSHAWFTSDLENWDGPHDVGDADYWMWGIQFHNGKGYSIGYHTVEPRSVRLYQTSDGNSFQTLVDSLKINDPYPNESAMVFDGQDVAFTLLRCKGSAQLGMAKPPYTQWTWKPTGAAVGGPEMIFLPDGRLLGGGRLYDGGARTSLFWLDREEGTLTEALKLPSSGDTSYPGFVIHEGKLYVSYYSSHEGKSSIYLAVVTLPETKGPKEVRN